MKTPYSLKAELYDKYRWDYPAEAIQWIVKTTNIKNSSVISDLGAGTGKLTRHFIPYSNHIYAVEPDMNMSRILIDKQFKNISIIRNYSHELKEIPDNSVDLIIAAHALHWFDFEKTIIELNRIAKENCFIVSVNNQSISENEKTKDIDAVLNQYKKNISYLKQQYNVMNYFKNNQIQEKTFDFIQENNQESYLGELSSVSYFPDKTDGDIYLKFKKDVERIFHKYSKNGKLYFSCQTKVGIGKLAVL
jgi:ubiquinone/menaquinone biosynthesis C-methylase UbiE